MAPGFEFWVARRYLRVRGKELFISLITWISVGGVALGVMTLIVVLSVMGGFERDLRDKILGSAAHVRIQAAKGGLGDYEQVARRAQELEEVVAATPFVEGQVMISAHGQARGVALRGVDPETISGVIDLDHYMQFGSLAELDPVAGERGEQAGAVIGSELARTMALISGDRLRLVSPAAASTPLGPVPRIRGYRLAGLFRTGMYEFDSGSVFIGLAEARDFFRLGDTVTGVELRVRDIYKADRVAAELGELLGKRYRVRDWTEMNRSLFGALKLEKLAMLLILGLIVLVAAFNIASTLIMVVMEKAKDIGVLKSMGASGRTVRRIFMLKGLMIGVVGTGMGLAGGWMVGFALQKYKFLRLPEDVYYIDTVPVVMDPATFGLVAACSVILCLLATLYPAWQAARLDPLETIRYE